MGLSFGSRQFWIFGVQLNIDHIFAEDKIIYITISNAYANDLF